MNWETILSSFLGSSPAALVLYLWVRSLQAQLEQAAADAKEDGKAILTLATTQAEIGALTRDRLKRLEYALGLRKAQPESE